MRADQSPIASASEAKLTPRREWVDYARGIAIIIVVFGHVVGGFKKTLVGGQPIAVDYTLYEFFRIIEYARMPLFFVISGLYIRRSYLKRGFKGFAGYKFATIFWPYLVWASIQLIFQILGYKYGVSHTPRSFFDFTYLLIRPDHLDQFWFLYALFETAIVFGLLFYFFKISRSAFLVLAAGCYVAFYFVPDEFFFLGVKYTLKFIFYLALGDSIATYFFNEKNKKLLSSLWLTLAVLVAFAGIKWLMYHYHVPEEETYFFTINNAILLISIAIGLACIINISLILERFSLLKWLRFIGRHSLYIYVMHIIVNGIARFAVLKIFNYRFPTLSLYLVAALSVIVPILLYKGFNRAGMWWLFKLNNKKQESN